MRWSKQGGTQEQFLKDRYDCITEARTRSTSGAAYGQYAAVHSGEVISASIVRPCLEARGYQMDLSGPFGPPGGVGVRAQ